MKKNDKTIKKSFLNRKKWFLKIESDLMRKKKLEI